MPISEFTVAKRYSTGIAQNYKANDIEFEWVDWLLCEISFRPGNPIHYCIAACFRSCKKKNGSLRITCTIFNPSYEDEDTDIDLDHLHHFKPLRIVHDVSEEPRP